MDQVSNRTIAFELLGPVRFGVDARLDSNPFKPESCWTHPQTMNLDPVDPSQYGFPENSIIYGCEPRAIKAIVDCRMRLRGAECFTRFWERVLSEQERTELDGDMEACFLQDSICANHLCRIRNWSPEHSIIEIGYRLGFLSPGDYQWLLDEIGLSTDQASPDFSGRAGELPDWNRESGELTLRGEILRSIRVRRAHNVVRVLDDFQIAGWPVCIENPVRSNNPQKCHELVQSLNTKLIRIRFRAHGDNICWGADIRTNS